jgi:hypothetical protein
VQRRNKGHLQTEELLTSSEERHDITQLIHTTATQDPPS